MKTTIKCESFRPWRRNTLLGFAEITISELHLKIKDVAVHEKAGARWAQLPSKPMLKDGMQVKGDDGKAQYVNIIEFTTREVRDAFSAAVIKAVIEHTPGAFEDGASTGKSVGTRDGDIPFATEWR